MTLREYEALLVDPSFLQTAPVTWDDEPMPWRRAWVRRFIERVELEESGAIAVRYRDGRVSHLDLSAPGFWAPRELEILHAIYDAPDRPARGWGERVRAALEAEGFNRSKHAIYHAAKAMKGSRAGQPKS